MNKTVITIGIIILLGVLFVGIAAVAIIRPDVDITILIGFAGTSITTIISFVVLFYGLNKVNERTDRIEKNTNGINTALLSRVTGHGEDTIQRFKEEVKHD